MTIQIVKRTKGRIPRKDLKRKIVLIAKAFAKQGHNLDRKALTLVFVSSSEMKRLNKKYRSKNSATDVLSFSSPDQEGDLGELILDLATIRREAKVSTRSALYMVIVHGILHLLGYDHDKSRRQAEIMFRHQDLVLKQLGLPPTDSL